MAAARRINTGADKAVPVFAIVAVLLKVLPFALNSNPAGGVTSKPDVR